MQAGQRRQPDRRNRQKPLNSRMTAWTAVNLTQIGASNRVNVHHRRDGPEDRRATFAGLETSIHDSSSWQAKVSFQTTAGPHGATVCHDPATVRATGGIALNEMLDVMGFAALSAQVLVTEMVKSTWAGTRGRVAKVFHRAGDDAEARQISMLDQDQEKIAQADDPTRLELNKDLQARWAVLLAAFLQQYPEAREDLQSMIEAADEAPDVDAAQASLSALNNVNSQVIQALGSINTGGGSITYQSPGRTE